MKAILAAFFIASISIPALAQKAADLKKPVVVNGKTYTYMEGMPYVEKGEMKNKPPAAKNEPAPIVKKITESPVQPTVVNGQPGVKYIKTYP
jgi:hypothetical protein